MTPTAPDGQSRTLAYLSGVGLTRFGRLPGQSALGLQVSAAAAAMDDAGVAAGEVDALLVGYATTHPHLMPANVLAEQLGMRPACAAGMSVGGATGVAMVAHAAHLVAAGAARHVLVVAGENRATGQSTSDSMGVLAGVGHPELEAPLGLTVPAYYALLASAYLYRHRLTADALAPLAVQLRAHAARHPGAHFRGPIEAGDVAASRPVAEPLRLLDCCPVSDGGAAVLVTRDPVDPWVRLTGTGGGNEHQHLSATTNPLAGARRAAHAALDSAGIRTQDVEYAAVYDSFTITLALLLEELGFTPAGGAGNAAAAGDFDLDGRLPLNTHGGLLSYGHSGVAGGIAHVVEAVLQLRGAAGDRQVRRADPAAGPRAPVTALVHADGGVMSAHATLVLTGPGRDWGRPGPAIPTPVTHASEHADAAAGTTREATGPLLLRQCLGCGAHAYLPVIACTGCGGRAARSVRADGRGTVIAATRVHRHTRGAGPPLTVVQVELVEGPRVLGHADGELAPGTAVTVAIGSHQGQPLFINRDR